MINGPYLLLNAYFTAIIRIQKSTKGSYKEGYTVSKVQKILGLIVGLILSGVVLAQSAAVSELIENRITPPGSTCMAGDACASAAVVASSGPRSGEEIYTASCAMCHGTGVAGAPKLGDASAWAPRLEQGLESLYAHAIEGFNGMPPKGMCMTCSDSELNATVDYMLDNSK